MALVLDGSSNFITGLSINSANIVDGSIVDADINNLAASKLTGALPAISGASLTNLPAGGKALQLLSTTKTNVYTEFIDGGEYSTNDITGLTLSITPSNANNKIFLIASLSHSANELAVNFCKAGSIISGARGDTSGAYYRVTSSLEAGDGYSLQTTTMTHTDTAGGTSAITYSLRLVNTSYYDVTFTINQNKTSRAAISRYNVAGVSSLTAIEVAP